MGEWSKKIGEQGENIVKYFFEELIGFKDVYRTGVSIHCSYSDQHKKEKAKQRLTHGIDGLVSYSCPLIEELLEIEGQIQLRFLVFCFGYPIMTNIKNSTFYLKFPIPHFQVTNWYTIKLLLLIMRE